MTCKYFDKGLCGHPKVINDRRDPKCIAVDKNGELQKGECALFAECDGPLGLKKKDMVDKPKHYSRYGIETIDALKGTMSPEEFNGFLKGNAFKYLTRAGAKDDLEQDLHKVVWYAAFLYLSNGGTVEKLKKTCEYMEGRFSK